MSTPDERFRTSTVGEALTGLGDPTPSHYLTCMRLDTLRVKVNSLEDRQSDAECAGLPCFRLVLCTAHSLAPLR